MTLHAPIALTIDEDAAEAHSRYLQASGSRFVLRHGASTQPPPAMLDPEATLRQTQAFWREWAGRFDGSKTHWPDPVRRSLITLKALVHRPTGGLVAALTTSLPEAPGGSMNWDYRYCWLRDATFALGALINAGYHEEAVHWRDWLLRAIGGSPGEMRIMYRVDGGRHLDEWNVPWLPGYGYAAPSASATLLPLSYKWTSGVRCWTRFILRTWPGCHHRVVPILFDRNWSTT